MIFLLDTNAITDFSRPSPDFVTNRNRRLRQGHKLGLCSPVYYESLRGLLKVNATTQITQLRNQVIPLFEWIPVIDTDWLQTAQFWADMETKGKKLSDMDLLIAAIAHRLDAVIVTGDADFEALPIRCENWRLPSP